MLREFAITFSEIGLKKLHIISLVISLIIFPVTFFVLSKNIDSRAVYGSMIDKSNKKIKIRDNKQIYSR